MPSYVRDSEMADSPVSLKSDRDGAATCHVDKLAGTFPAQDCSLSISELDKETQGSKKTHHRSVTAVRVSDMMSSEGANVGSKGSKIGVVSNQTVEGIAEEGHSDSKPSAQIAVSELPKESVSSNESSSTVTGPPREKRKDRTRRNTITKSSPGPKYDAMDYLDPDSPRLTTESIQRSLRDSLSHQTPRTSSSSRSATSSLRSSPYSDGFSDDADHDSDWSTSPEQSPASRKSSVRPVPLSRRHKSYGTPEMPRGNVDFPHLSPEALTSRPMTQTQGHHIKHLPRAEKLPLTGYEQLAFQLAGHGFGTSGPYLRPMYRRFETLNHRLLLHLQDEICELEEQLHRLDTADTQTRRLQNCILPASRRAEALSGGELQWHKTDILGKIGFKLEQYNRVLSSFKSTESFAKPTMADVHEYRGYLATYSPIAEPETRFLDISNDLVCLSDPLEDSGGEDEDMAATPMPRRQSVSFGSHKTPGDYFAAVVEQPMIAAQPNIPISLVMVVAVVVPIMTFSVIPGYLGRMVVVFLVGTGVLGALVQGQAVNMHGTKDFCICAGAYGIIMTVVAGLYR